MRQKQPESLPALSAAAAAQANAPYVVRLYVKGATSRSGQAVVKIRRICEDHLAGLYDLEVVDIAQHPTLADGEQIIAVPPLIKKLPPPLLRLIGDISQTERILISLDLRDAAEPLSSTGNH